MATPDELRDFAAASPEDQQAFLQTIPAAERDEFVRASRPAPAASPVAAAPVPPPTEPTYGPDVPRMSQYHPPTMGETVRNIGSAVAEIPAGLYHAGKDILSGVAAVPEFIGQEFLRPENLKDQAVIDDTGQRIGRGLMTAVTLPFAPLAPFVRSERPVAHGEGAGWGGSLGRMMERAPDTKEAALMGLSVLPGMEMARRGRNALATYETPEYGGLPLQKGAILREPGPPDTSDMRGPIRIPDQVMTGPAAQMGRRIRPVQGLPAATEPLALPPGSGAIEVPPTPPTPPAPREPYLAVRPTGQRVVSEEGPVGYGEGESPLQRSRITSREMTDIEYVPIEAEAAGGGPPVRVRGENPRYKGISSASPDIQFLEQGQEIPPAPRTGPKPLDIQFLEQEIPPATEPLTSEPVAARAANQVGIQEALAGDEALERPRAPDASDVASDVTPKRGARSPDRVWEPEQDPVRSAEDIEKSGGMPTLDEVDNLTVKELQRYGADTLYKLARILDPEDLSPEFKQRFPERAAAAARQSAKVEKAWRGLVREMPSPNVPPGRETPVQSPAALQDSLSEIFQVKKRPSRRPRSTPLNEDLPPLAGARVSSRKSSGKKR